MGVKATVGLFNKLRGLSVEVISGVAEGETKAAERLLTLAKAEAPLEIGTLIGSGAVIPSDGGEDGAAVVFDTPYAAKLHEHPEYNFQNGRKGKYLEDPAVANKAELGAIIAKEIGNAST